MKESIYNYIRLFDYVIKEGIAVSQEKKIGFFEHYLTLWIFLCMIAGALVGEYLPAVPERLEADNAGYGRTV